MQTDKRQTQRPLLTSRFRNGTALLFATVVISACAAAGSDSGNPGVVASDVNSVSESLSGNHPRPVDPGVRSGASAGGAISGLGTHETDAFNKGLDTFGEEEDVQGGLGPRFNADSCAACHAQPATGGTSPALNPLIAIATKSGANNSIPPFITLNGPVREARFKFNPDGSRDGGVHDLFVITGRFDAPGCPIQQPDFATAIAENNIIFRIPTPTFGAGLIEAIPDRTILANKNANQAQKQALGISGHENRSGNDGTITRFGWKAQNKSLTIFTGEAYNVEQGVTNLLFPNEREDDPQCVFTGTPEDHTHFDAATPLDALSDVDHFVDFMRFSAPPTPATDSGNGRQLFEQVGCASCHTPTLHTGVSSVAALSNQDVNLFSDLLVHHMGTGLADDVVQGGAGPDEFRTAPLWGAGQRIFFLHDGRTSDIYVAIQAHKSDGSEANKVINNFNKLSLSDQQAILNFLRSL